MHLGLDGRVAIVTGAGSGIGLATARRLADEGARVVAADLNCERVDGVDAHAVQIDLAVPGSGDRLVEAARDRFGGVHILVNCVGVRERRDGGFLAIDDAAWAESLQLNLFTAIRCMRAAIPEMVRAGSGSIVSIASRNAREPGIDSPDYGVGKAALVNLTKVVSMEFGGQGIRCNVVSPGPTLTPQLSEQIAAIAAAEGTSPATVLEKWLAFRRTALPRMGEVDDVSAVVAFLVSDRAAQVTGSEYRVDGGAVQSL